MHMDMYIMSMRMGAPSTVLPARGSKTGIKGPVANSISLLFQWKIIKNINKLKTILGV